MRKYLQSHGHSLISSDAGDFYYRAENIAGFHLCGTLNKQSNSLLMHWQIDCSDLCTSPTIGFSVRLMSGIMLNYKLLFEGFTLLQLQLFPAIMVVAGSRGGAAKAS